MNARAEIQPLLRQNASALEIRTETPDRESPFFSQKRIHKAAGVIAAMAFAVLLTTYFAPYCPKQNVQSIGKISIIASTVVLSMSVCVFMLTFRPRI